MSDIPAGTRMWFAQDHPPSGWTEVTTWPVKISGHIYCEKLPDILCKMGDGSEPRKCSKCSRKMQKSATKPGKVYCLWCREYADAPKGGCDDVPV